VTRKDFSPLVTLAVPETTFQLDLDPFQVFFSDMAVVFSLFRIIGNDKPPSASAFANEDLFGMEILFDDLKPAAPVQGLFIYSSSPEFFTQDILSPGSLQISPVLFAGHAPVLESFGDALINADAFPQPFEQQSPSGRLTGDELDASALGFQFLGIFGADEAAEAGDEALEGRHIQLVPPPKGVHDLGPGVAFFGVPGVVG
jgi:hypothetical protein